MNKRRTVLLLPGQGAQRAQMAVGLYGADPVFTRSMDDFFAGQRGTGSRRVPDGARLREVWMRKEPGHELDATAIAQPLLYAVGHALGRAVGCWAQAAPDILLGHSVGELAAACLAGVFTPDDAARLMARRSAVLDAQPTGGMLAVAATAAELSGLLGPNVVAGAVNGPRQTVLAGPDVPLDEVARRLTAAGLIVRRLRSQHGFHSPSMRPAAEELARILDGIPLRAPRLEVRSGRTSRRVERREAVRPDFWADQVALPVLFWPALRRLLDEADAGGAGMVLLDASPDRSLSSPARRHRAVRSGLVTVVPLLPPAGGGTDADAAAFAEAHRVCAGSTLPAP